MIAFKRDFNDSKSVTDIFNDIYDPYNMFFTNGHYGAENCIFCQSEYLEIILDNDGLFNSMFEIKSYELKLGNISRRKKQVESITYRSINPIINNCLKYALKHLDKYKHRAIDILKFGIEHNRKIASKLTFTDCYICNELGGLKNFKDENYYDIVVVIDMDVDVNDDEIKSLTNQLLKFNKLCD